MRKFFAKALRTIGLTLLAACSQAESADFQVPTVESPCVMQTDIAVVPDRSGSMIPRARIDITYAQLDTLTTVAARCGGGVQLVVVGDATATRLESVSFPPIPEEPPPTASSDSLGLVADAANRRKQASLLAEYERRLATRSRNVALQRSAFLHRARLLLDRTRLTDASSSPVCRALTDVSAWMARPRQSSNLRVFRVALLSSDLKATDRTADCPTTLMVDAVYQLADPSADGLRLSPSPNRVYALSDVLAALPTTTR